MCKRESFVLSRQCFTDVNNITHGHEETSMHYHVLCHFWGIASAIFSVQLGIELFKALWGQFRDGNSNHLFVFLENVLNLPQQVDGFSVVSLAVPKVVWKHVALVATYFLHDCSIFKLFFALSIFFKWSFSIHCLKLNNLQKVTKSAFTQIPLCIEKSRCTKWAVRIFSSRQIRNDQKCISHNWPKPNHWL